MHYLSDIFGCIYNCVAVNPQIYISTNLALGKPTKQSTTYKTYSSSKAVDGKKSNVLRENSCAHTMGQKGAWWQVDLGAVYEIRQVVIINRGDCCGQFINGVVNLLFFISSTYGAVST